MTEAEMTEANSPLNEIAAARRPALTLQELPFLGYLNLRGQPGEAAFMKAVKSAVAVDLPVEPNTVASKGALSALWLAPDEWLLVTAPGAQAELETKLNNAIGDLFAGVTDISSGYTTIEVAGFDAPDLLARGTSVDLHPRAFGPGRCAQTLLAKTTATLVQVDDRPTFHVIVRRSFADYLWRWLTDAAASMGAATGTEYR